MQHFRKKGPLTPFIFIALLPFIYAWLELLYQHYPDEDHYRISHPPPLEYPFVEDTDDLDTYEHYHTKSGRYLRDSGIIDELWYDIVDEDGEKKKVYKPWAGVNQPLPDI